MKIIDIDGVIGIDLDSVRFGQMLAESNGDDVEVHISTPGGLIIDGIRMYNQVRDYKRNFPQSQMMAIIKSQAASMGSYLFSNPAFDLKYVEDNGTLMIHNPYNGMIGDYRDMMKNANYLDGLATLLAKSYAEASGKSVKEIRDMMDAETWLFGDEIVKAGFADGTIPSGSKDINKTESLALAKANFKDAKNKTKPESLDSPDYLEAVAIASQHLTAEPHREEKPADDNNPKMEEKMNLQEFIKSNPEAKAEYDALLQAAEASGNDKASLTLMADRERLAKILELEGVELSETAAKAIAGEMSVESYMEEELKRQKGLRAEGKDKNPFGKLVAKQTPKEQDPKGAKEAEGANLVDFEAKAREAAKKVMGGK